MASTSSKPSRRNSQPAHPAGETDDKWKSRPSAETTSDRGENARRARARKVAENTPRKKRRA
jgi:hypothetical protein